MILPAELAGEGLMRAVCRWTGSVVRCGVALCLSSQVQDRVVGCGRADASRTDRQPWAGIAANLNRQRQAVDEVVNRPGCEPIQHDVGQEPVAVDSVFGQVAGGIGPVSTRSWTPTWVEPLVAASHQEWARSVQHSELDL